jgi:hypothetical protein
MSGRWLFLSCFLLVGCGDASRSDGAGCAAGATQSCPCSDGTSGTQSCSGGTLGACQCAAPAVCGDFQCTGGENCLTCASDCGACPACPGTPSCDTAAGIPVAPTHEAALDVPASSVDGGAGAPPAAPDNCQAAQLRLRIASVTANSGGGSIYCIVSATDGVSSEVAITTKTKSLADGETDYFDPGVAIFWGQQGLHPTTNNITVTYDCFKVGSDAWSNVLQAISSSSMMVAGVAGAYGWAFGAASVAASAAAAGVQAASGDDHRFNAQQTIDRARLYELTNGRTWDLHQSGGCGVFCSWDWTVTVESWGCAAEKPGPM